MYEAGIEHQRRRGTVQYRDTGGSLRSWCFFMKTRIMLYSWSFFHSLSELLVLRKGWIRNEGSIIEQNETNDAGGYGIYGTEN